MPGNPKDLARAMDYWFDHPHERDYMAHLYAEEAFKYHIDKSIDQFEEMQSEAIQEHQV